jgi:hypothetical protein
MSAPTDANAPVARGGSQTTEQQASPKDSTTTATSKRPWREVFKVHPAAEMFPLLGKDELRELADDIKKNGLRSRIVLFEDADSKAACVLDGRNRLDALELLGADLFPDSCNPDFFSGVYTTADIADPLAWVISANIRRRHLNGEQKRELIAKLLTATPEKSNNAIAKTANVDDKTVAKVREEMEARSEIPNVATRTDSKGRAQPAKKQSKPKTIKATIVKEDRPPQVVNLTTTKGEPKPVDLLAAFKKFATQHLYALPINERTTMARRWRAHLDATYLPERGESIVDVAKRVVQ